MMTNDNCPKCRSAVKPWRFSIEGWSERTGVECTKCDWFRDAEPFENNDNKKRS